VLPAVILSDTQATEITAIDEATGALLNRLCTPRLPDLRKFARRHRGALFTLHVWCRPVVAERVKAMLGVPTLYDSTASGGRLHIFYPGDGAAPREIIVLADGEIYAWCGLSVSFPSRQGRREIIRDVLLVITVRPEAPRRLRPPPARGSTPQLPLTF
jgi:hypothetical protein